MENSEYELVSKVQYQHWWWLGRKKLIESVIEGYIDLSRKLAIADVGCGYGANIPMLRQYGDVVGLELNKEAISEIENTWGSSVQTVIWKSPEAINQKFDLILMADVLEHIPNDREAVDWIFEHLSDTGRILLTVPAHMYLWSEMDDVVHHYRRYNRAALLGLFEEKFIVEKISYYNFFLFPIKVAFVLFSSLKQKVSRGENKRSYNDVPSPAVNRLFKYIMYIEIKLIKHLSLPTGAGMILLARKK